MKKIEKFALLGFIGVIAILMIATKIKENGGSNKLYEDHKDSYTEVKYVDGLSFEVPTAFLNNSTPVSILNENDSVYLSGIWLYKTANSQYELFQYDEFVLLVLKGTKFDLANELSESIKNVPLIKSWFTLDNDNKTVSGVDQGVKKEIITVEGDVSINPQFYGVYTGKLAVLSDGAEEWAIFAGVPGESYRKMVGSQKTIVSHIISSAMLTGEKSEPEEPVQTDIPEKVDISDETNSNVAEPAETDNQNPVSDSTSEEIPGTTTELPEENPITVEKYVVYTDKYARESSLSEPIKEMTTAKVSVYNGTGYSDTFVRLISVDSGAVAETISKELCEERGTVYEEVPIAHKRYLATFSAGVSPDFAFMTAIITGADGGPVIVNGVKSNIKTHIVTTRVKEVIKEDNGYYGNYYCFFDIPNGCDGFILSFCTEDGEKSAFYEVK